MKVHVEELSPVEKKLSIEVEHARVAEELTRAYGTLSRQVKVPGFRPGKVPRHVLEKRFREQVEDDVIQRVVQSAWTEAILKHGLQPVGQPRLTSQPSLQPGQPFSFEARVEVRPVVQTKDYRELPLTRVELKVEDKEVDDQVSRIQENLSRLEPIADRDVAAKGDFATVDFTATIDGQPFPGSQADGVTVEIVPGELIDSNLAALEGVKVGDTKELDYAFPPDYRVEEVKGKTAHFVMKLQALKRKVKPELNDELAKEAGMGQSLEELRNKVREDLVKARQTRARAEERDQVLKKLVERNPLEVPGSMVERAVDSLVQNRVRAMARLGLNPEMLRSELMQMRDDVREQALLEVRGALLLESVAEQEGIQVSDDEVEKRIEQLAEENQQKPAAVRKYFQERSDERAGLRLGLRDEKTIEFLKAQAKYS